MLQIEGQGLHPEQDHQEPVPYNPPLAETKAITTWIRGTSTEETETKRSLLSLPTYPMF